MESDNFVANQKMPSKPGPCWIWPTVPEGISLLLPDLLDRLGHTIGRFWWTHSDVDYHTYSLSLNTSDATWLTEERAEYVWGTWWYHEYVAYEGGDALDMDGRFLSRLWETHHAPRLSQVGGCWDNLRNMRQGNEVELILSGWYDPAVGFGMDPSAFDPDLRELAEKPWFTTEELQQMQENPWQYGKKNAVRPDEKKRGSVIGKMGGECRKKSRLSIDSGEEGRVACVIQLYCWCDTYGWHG